MPTFKINLDYKRTEQARSEISDRGLTVNYIEGATNRKYELLEGQKRRVFARIQRKLDEALEKELDTIDLENAEVDFLKDVFNDIKFETAISKFVVILEDEIDRMGKENE